MHKQGGIVRGGESTSHANGGVRYTVKSTGDLVELEGDEIVLCEDAIKSTRCHTITGTHLEILKEIADTYGCGRGTLEQISAHEFVICKKVVRDTEAITVSGTPAEIVSYIQVQKGCNPHWSWDLNREDCSVCKFENGGDVTPSLTLIRGVGKNSTSNMDLFGRGLYLTDDRTVAQYYGDTIMEHKVVGKIYDASQDFSLADLRAVAKELDKNTGTGAGTQFIQDLKDYNDGHLPKNTDVGYQSLLQSLTCNGKLYKWMAANGYAKNKFNSDANYADLINGALANLGYIGVKYSTDAVDDLSDNGLGGKNAYLIFADGLRLAPNGRISNLTAEQYKVVRTSEFKKWFGDWQQDPANASKVLDENGEPKVLYHFDRRRFRMYLRKIGDGSKFYEFNTKDKEMGSHFGTKNQVGLMMRALEITEAEADDFIYEVFIDIKNPVRGIDTGYFNSISLADAILDKYGDAGKEVKEIHDIESDIMRVDPILSLRGSGLAAHKAFELAKEYHVDGIVYLNRFESNLLDELAEKFNHIDELTDIELKEGFQYLEDSYIVFEPTQVKLADGSNTTFAPTNPDIRYEMGGDIKLYHGSNKNFDEFSEDLISTGENADLFGKGLYLTDNRAIAEAYAKNRAMKEHISHYTPTGIFKSEVPHFKDGAEELAEKEKYINEFRVNGNILDAETYLIPEDFKQRILELWVKYSFFPIESGERVFDYLKTNKDKIHAYRGELWYVIMQIGFADKKIVEGITDYIKSLGYDGIKYPTDIDYEKEGGYNYVIFNKNKIKKVYEKGGQVELSEKQFYRAFPYQHKDIRSKTESEMEQTKNSILANGFNSSTSNTLPTYTGREWDVISAHYGNKKGDIVYLLRSEGVVSGGKTKVGYKPAAGDIIRIAHDGQSSYEAYASQVKKMSNGGIIQFYEPDTMMPMNAGFGFDGLTRSDIPMFERGGFVADKLQSDRRAIEGYMQYLNHLNDPIRPLASITEDGCSCVILDNADADGRRKMLYVLDGIIAPAGFWMDVWEPDHQKYFCYTESDYKNAPLSERAALECRLQLKLWVRDEFWFNYANFYMPQDFSRWQEGAWENDLDEQFSYWRKKLGKPEAQKFEKGGVVIPPQATEAQIEARWEKKKDHIMQLASSIRKLRYNVTVDMKSEDEKTKLTALVVAIMDKTSERIGNDSSASDGHFGVTGFQKRHVKVNGNTITLKYRGKSGVDHIKVFSDEAIAMGLKWAKENSPSKYVFTTSGGFKIKADRVNRYLRQWEVSCKDLRAFGANKHIIEKLRGLEIAEDEKGREKQFREAVKYAALKVGHGAATLKKHYLIPELEKAFILHGEIIDLSDFYKDGGLIKMEEGGELYQGRSAAGVFLIARTTGRGLLLLRSAEVSESNTWAFVSGEIDGDETPEQAVYREMEEEIGLYEQMRLRLIYTYEATDADFTFYNFVGLVDDEFVPELNFENEAYRWVDLDTLPDNVHFGVSDIYANIDVLSEIVELFTEAMDYVPEEPVATKDDYISKVFETWFITGGGRIEKSKMNDMIEGLNAQRRPVYEAIWKAFRAKHKVKDEGEYYLSDVKQFKKLADEKFAEGGEIPDSVDEVYRSAIKLFEDNEYDISKGENSKTAFGHSRYFYVNYKERTNENIGNGIKVRVSDHSVSSITRMQTEVLIDASRPLLSRALLTVDTILKPELFTPAEERFDYTEELIVGGNAYNPETDEILEELGLSKRNHQKYKVRRKRYGFHKYLIDSRTGAKRFLFADGGEVSSIYNPKAVSYIGEVDRLGAGADAGNLLAPNGKLSNLTAEQWRIVRTPAFMGWFGNWLEEPKSSSKVLDSNGEPLIVYHGSPNSFDVFDTKRMGTQGTTEGHGFYFTPNKGIATGYAEGGKLFEVFLNIRNPYSDHKKTITKAQLRGVLLELHHKDPEFALSNYGDISSDGLNAVLREAVDIEYSSDTDTSIVGSLVNGGVGTVEAILLAVKKVTGKDGVFSHWKGDTIETPIYIAIEPAQIKIADGTNEKFDPANPDVRYNKGGEVEFGKDNDKSLEKYKLDDVLSYFSKLPDIAVSVVDATEIHRQNLTGNTKFKITEKIDGNSDFVHYFSPEKLMEISSEYGYKK